MPELTILIERLEKLIAAATIVLSEDRATVEEWQRQIEELLTRYHQAAYMIGADTPVITNPARLLISQALHVQFKFLNNFALAIQSESEWKRGYEARAKSYAKSVKVAYWQGKTTLTDDDKKPQVLPLPAMPAQGTQCHNNCGCSWNIVAKDKDKGNFDCFWIRGKDDSCQTCVQRAQNWSPLKIRDWRLA